MITHLYAIFAFLFLSTMALAPLLLIFRRWRLAGVVAGTCITCFAIFVELGNLNARSKGFDDFDQLIASEKAGITNPVSWKAVVEEKARVAAAQAEVERVNLAQEASRARVLADQQRVAFEKQAAAEQAARALADRRILIIQAAEQTVRSRLKDPGSAEIKSISTSTDGFGHLIVCGGVNAKNSFGGYTGMKGFVVTPETGYLEIEGSSNQTQFDIAWTYNCKS